MGSICAIGDVHGHLQLALCLAAEWQARRGERFEAILLCGDVGTFPDEAVLDRATRRHATTNPCELEFPRQWMTSASHLDGIFADDGLGLDCPVLMTAGNHEGFDLLERIAPAGYPREPVRVEDLPIVDPGERIRLLPSGWVVEVGRTTVGAVGGVERGQRRADYHPMAYIDERAVDAIARLGPDVLITHQGPARVQGAQGAASLDRLLDRRAARVWCHGHSVADDRVGDRDGCLVVPLRGVPFDANGVPGTDAWAAIDIAGPSVERGRPDSRRYHRRRWLETPVGPVSPTLAAAYGG